MMTNASMNLDRLDNDKRLDEGVAVLLTRLGPLERLECLDELESSRWQRRL